MRKLATKRDQAIGSVSQSGSEFFQQNDLHGLTTPNRDIHRVKQCILAHVYLKWLKRLYFDSRSISSSSGGKTTSIIRVIPTPPKSYPDDKKGLGERGKCSMSASSWEWLRPRLQGK